MGAAGDDCERARREARRTGRVKRSLPAAGSCRRRRAPPDRETTHWIDIGARAERPRREDRVACAGMAGVQRILEGFVAPRESPEDLRTRTRDFKARTERSPVDYAAAWRGGEIEDTPQNARAAIEALALREAMQPSVLSA
jgi:hypothetical protein